MRSSIIFVLLMTACLANVLRNNVKYYFHKKYLIGERKGTIYSVKVPTGNKDGPSYLLGTIIMYDKYEKGPSNPNSISVGDIEINKNEPDCNNIDYREDNDNEFVKTNTSAEGGEDNNDNSKESHTENRNHGRERDRDDQHKHHNKNKSYGRTKKVESSDEKSNEN